MDRPPYRYGGQVNKNKNKDGDIDMAVRLSLQYNLFLGHDAFIKLAVSQRMGGATLQEVPPTLKKEQGVSLGCTLWFIVANEERARNYNVSPGIWFQAVLCAVAWLCLWQCCAVLCCAVLCLC
jgi:hypothetical protein